LRRERKREHMKKGIEQPGPRLRVNQWEPMAHKRPALSMTEKWKSIKKESGEEGIHTNK